MNKQTTQGEWKILRGKIKQAWGKLTDDQIESTKGDLQKLEGEIQKAYGLKTEEAKKKYEAWKKTLP